MASKLTKKTMASLGDKEKGAIVAETITAMKTFGTDLATAKKSGVKDVASLVLKKDAHLGAGFSWNGGTEKAFFEWFINELATTEGEDYDALHMALTAKKPKPRASRRPACARLSVARLTLPAFPPSLTAAAAAAADEEEEEEPPVRPDTQALDDELEEADDMAQRADDMLEQAKKDKDRAVKKEKDALKLAADARDKKRKAGSGLVEQKLFDKKGKKAKGAGAGAGAGASKHEKEEDDDDDEEEEEEEETLKRFLAANKAHFTFFRSKKAITLEGAVIKSVVLTATEEDSFEPADLMKLAKWGLVKEEEGSAGAGAK
jgi:hypothetical protein